ncbi:MarR family winged helix-turn-helix transcriptional regulator [Pseudahrensia aquimaris]|uniref:MarR family winged helix-turn-helix transcriptional regulator n=1 Tax=Pseudahrensia aquimaris TaxID=744461 RepID=A0ABW3F9T6_9HYPH
MGSSRQFFNAVTGMEDSQGKSRNGEQTLPTVVGAPIHDGHDQMTSVKLWQNPCWFTYRLNYLALRYNGPLYAWVEEHYGLSRPEFVVIFSLGLMDGAYARDIGASSGFPQNTLSRAIHKLTQTGLISREPDQQDGRRYIVSLTRDGRDLFNEALPKFVSFEKMMLDSLSDSEQQTLSHLMAKMVLASPQWPKSISEKADA